MKIGIVTCREKQFLTESEQLLLPIFKSYGHFAEPLVWNDPAIQWKEYDGLIIRSVWDYHLKGASFDYWLNTIEQLKVKTLNPISLIRKNKNKFYLKDLLLKGVPIIPTIFHEKSTQFSLSFLQNHPWEQAVIKPAL